MSPAKINSRLQTIYLLGKFYDSPLNTLSRISFTKIEHEQDSFCLDDTEYLYWHNGFIEIA